MDETGLNCPKCGYNLTGLTRHVCPECGTAFDLELLRTDPELRRTGTPVYGKRGLRLIRSTVATLLLLLFRPKSFALRMRVDEPLAPAVVVFLMSVGLNVRMLFGLRFGGDWRWRLAYEWLSIVVFISAMVLLVLAFAIVFATGSVRGRSRVWAFPRRFRFWCIVIMYTMIFLPLWPLFFAGSYPPVWSSYWAAWPFTAPRFYRNPFSATIILLWWIFIICVILWHRNRPRRLAIIFMLLAFLFVRSFVQIVDVFIPRLSR